MIEVGKIIALDVGNVRIGVAISDPTGTLASPKDSIKRHDGIALILKLIDTEKISLILIGMPYLPSGATGTQAQHTVQFIDSLSEKTKIPIKIVDERMSTIEAKKKLSESTRSKRYIQKNKGVIDSAAAAVILQSYLDSI